MQGDAHANFSFQRDEVSDGVTDACMGTEAATEHGIVEAES